MLEMLAGVFNVFLKDGVDAFKKSKEFKNITIAIQDRIRRESRFNSAILQEISKEDDDNVKIALIKSLRTEAFDVVNNGSIPLSLFFSEGLNKDKWPRKWEDADQYFKWTNSDKTQFNLLERIYHRISLAKTFAGCGKAKGDLEYIRFMLVAFDISTKSIAIDK